MSEGCNNCYSDVDYIREKRLMLFTSLLRTKGFVSHARVLQCYKLFEKFVKEYPTGCKYTIKHQNVDHNNMRLFLERLND